MPSPLRFLLHAAGVVAGVLAGVLGSFVHSVGIPGGLLLALVLTVLACATGGLLTGARSGAAGAAVGWLLPVLLLSSARPEGDLVVSGSLTGYVWLGGGALCAVVAVAWPWGAGPGAASSAPEGNVR